MTTTSMSTARAWAWMVGDWAAEGALFCAAVLETNGRVEIVSKLRRRIQLRIASPRKTAQYMCEMRPRAGWYTACSA